MQLIILFVLFIQHLFILNFYIIFEIKQYDLLFYEATLLLQPFPFSTIPTIIYHSHFYLHSLSISSIYSYLQPSYHLQLLKFITYSFSSFLFYLSSYSPYFKRHFHLITIKTRNTWYFHYTQSPQYQIIIIYYLNAKLKKNDRLKKLSNSK